MLYELILINEIEQRAKIIFLSVGYRGIHYTQNRLQHQAKMNLLKRN